MKNLHSILIAALASGAFAAPSWAQETSSRTQEVDALIECRAIEDVEQKAACYDSATDAFTSVLDTGQVAIIDRRTVRAVEREGFGLGLNFAGLRDVFSRGDATTEDGETAELAAAPSTETLEDGAVAEYTASGELDALRDTPVARVRENPYGKLIIELENGQTWVQTDSVNLMRVRQRHIDRGMTAEIERAALGSFRMKLSHDGRSFRVERRD